MALSRDFEERQKERQRQRRIERERRRKLQKLWLVLFGILVVLIIILCATKCSHKRKSPAPTAIATEAAEIVPSPAPTQSMTGFGNIPSPSVGNNDFLDVIKASGQTKHVYLTFDEGPDPNVTPKLLDALRRYNVKATFFVIGREIEKYPYLITRIMDEGHLVLPLSYSGNTDRLYADKNDFIDEINKTYELITDNTPIATNPIKIYRFPGGSGENTTYGTAKQSYKEELAKNGYYYCDWNTTIGDENGTRTAEQLVQYFNGNRPQLNNLVIRLCNTDKNANTAEALKTIISGLISEGYVFSRLDEIESNGTINTAAAATAQPAATESASVSDTAATTPPANATNSSSNTSGTLNNTTTGAVSNTTNNTTNNTSSAAAPARTNTTTNTTTNTATAGTSQAGTSQATTGSGANTSAATSGSGTPAAENSDVLNPE